MILKKSYNESATYCIPRIKAEQLAIVTIELRNILAVFDNNPVLGQLASHDIDSIQLKNMGCKISGIGDHTNTSFFGAPGMGAN
ncbi:hypothetical protein ACFP1H_09035 [Secundilactobacillus hailunensis]|uniref:Uncharacterized protein n=1 Tax=Secundilactobacillus hailunensis TaxID=2559923 RepID=A0ABW1TAG6_9LACO|nr:hypothetical protein [Secundilactobacillus hailunensis]